MSQIWCLEAPKRSSRDRSHSQQPIAEIVYRPCLSHNLPGIPIQKLKGRSICPGLSPLLQTTEFADTDRSDRLWNLTSPFAEVPESTACCLTLRPSRHHCSFLFCQWIISWDFAVSRHTGFWPVCGQCRPMRRICFLRLGSAG